MNRPDIFHEISRERKYQDGKWGEAINRKLGYTTWLAVLTEETGEVSQAILNQNLINLRMELIQVAAVAVAMLECIDELHVNPERWGFSHEDAG